jgi:glycosyltransferase involved in cell wall biosynthesis
MTLRIAWSSNAPWTGSGYGVQTAEVVPRLVADGHEVAILANHGLAGSIINWGNPPVPVFPQGIDAYSNDIHPAQIANHIGDQRHRGLGLTLFDVWVFKAPQWDEVPLLCWTPIDHNPVTPEVSAFFNRPGRKWALAMSKFGEQALLDSGVSRERVFYAPHSYDPNIFKPEGETMRDKMQIPADAHVTMMNAANKGNTPIRKCFPENLAAWSEFARRHDDAFLYLHTEASGIANGVNIHRLLKAVGAPEKQVRVVPQFEYRMGISAQTVAALVRSSDVLLGTARGEGFGVPTLEAQATGVPVIVTNWTASPELVGHGWIVEGQKEWDEFQASFWKLPSVDGIIDALEQSYALKGDAARLSEARAASIKFAEPYQTDNVFATHWRPLLASMETLLAEGIKPINREQRRAAVRGKR